jgi:hypothetical protein
MVASLGQIASGGASPSYDVLQTQQQTRRRTFGLPSQTERLNPLRIGSYSLAIGPLCDSRIPGLDLDGRRCRQDGCSRQRFRFAGRCLRQRIRNRSGNERRLSAGIDVHPRRTHPIRSDSDDRLGHVAVGDGFHFGEEG